VQLDQVLGLSAGAVDLVEQVMRVAGQWRLMRRLMCLMTVRTSRPADVLPVRRITTTGLPLST
jgi:hypothetical protein